MANSVLRVQHSSLQFSDTTKQQGHDVRKLFEKGKDFPIKTGTESGPEDHNENLDFLVKYSKEFNHAFHAAAGNWIAIDRKIIKKGTVKRGKVFVVSNDAIVGHMHDRVMPTMSFVHVDEGIGKVSQGAAHYPTKGQTPGDPNYDINRMYAHKIFAWMTDASAKNAISFVNGDFNMPDPRTDWSFGTGWTSMADELKAWQNTGHGPIDGFASYDKDTRVSAKKFVVLDDKEQFMFTDHFVCQGVWEIRLLIK